MHQYQGNKERGLHKGTECGCAAPDSSKNCRLPHGRGIASSVCPVFLESAAHPPHVSHNSAPAANAVRGLRFCSNLNDTAAIRKRPKCGQAGAEASPAAASTAKRHAPCCYGYYRPGRRYPWVSAQSSCCRWTLPAPRECRIDRTAGFAPTTTQGFWTPLEFSSSSRQLYPPVLWPRRWYDCGSDWVTATPPPFSHGTDGICCHLHGDGDQHRQRWRRSSSGGDSAREQEGLPRTRRDWGCG